MEYNSIFEPLLLICSCMLVGFVAGSLVTFHILAKEHKKVFDKKEEYKCLYFRQLNLWTDKYTDKDPCERFRNIDDRFF
jgi:hypothetical protein